MCAQDTCIYKGQLTQLVHSFFNPSVNALSVRPIINPSIRMYSQGQKFGSRFLLHRRPLANSAMMSPLTAHCQWEDETVRERTGQPPSYAEAKKMKSLTLHTHGCAIGLA